MNVPPDANDLFYRLDLNDGSLDGTVTRDNLIKAADKSGEGELSEKEYQTWKRQNVEGKAPHFVADRLDKLAGDKIIPPMPLLDDVTPDPKAPKPTPISQVTYDLSGKVQMEMAAGKPQTALALLGELAKNNPDAALALIQKLPGNMRLDLLEYAQSPAGKAHPLPPAVRDALTGDTDATEFRRVERELQAGRPEDAMGFLASLAASDATTARTIVAQLSEDQRLDLINTLYTGKMQAPKALKEALWGDLKDFTQSSNAAWRLTRVEDAPRVLEQLNQLAPAERKKMLDHLFTRASFSQKHPQSFGGKVQKSPASFAAQMALLKRMSHSDDPSIRHAVIHYREPMFLAAQRAEPYTRYAQDQVKYKGKQADPSLAHVLAYYQGAPITKSVWKIDSNTKEIQMAIAQSLVHDASGMVQHLVKPGDKTLHDLTYALMALMDPPHEEALQLIQKEMAMQLTLASDDTLSEAKRVQAARTLGQLVGAINQAAASLPEKQKPMIFELLVDFFDPLIKFVPISSKAQDVAKAFAKKLKPKDGVSQDEYVRKYQELKDEFILKLQATTPQIHAGFDFGLKPYEDSATKVLK